MLTQKIMLDSTTYKFVKPDSLLLKVGSLPRKRGVCKHFQGYFGGSRYMHYVNVQVCLLHFPSFWVWSWKEAGEPYMITYHTIP